MEELTRLEEQRLALQERCDRNKTQGERNRLGQFATPPDLALGILALAKTILRTGQQVRFLDPAFGTGSFFSALLRTFGPECIAAAEGFETDPHYGEPARDLWRSSKLRLHISDFTRAEPPKNTERFNLVVCNPPYVRHHHLKAEEKARLRHMVQANSGVRLGGLAGLYCYFLLLADAWMTEDGIAVWLVPSEFMDVNYGVSLKRYLLSKVTLIRVHRFHPENVQFGDALVSSSVVCFRKTLLQTAHSVEFTFGGTLAHSRVSRIVPLSALRAESKWTGHPAPGAQENAARVTLSDFFTIKRGLATGDNKFFILTREQIKQNHLPMTFFRPILPSPRYLSSDEINADEDGNPMLKQQVFLLDCRVPERELGEKYPALWRYLETGKSDVARRYLCRSRSPWYSQEQRPAALLVCTYMGRANARGGRPFRFILNHSRATAANVYLLLYPKPVLAQALEVKSDLARKIWNLLNELSPQMLLGQGRVYGGGLHKLEPKELGNVPADEIARLLRLPMERTGVQLDLLSLPKTATSA
jgi:adenine-specific DNA-methyltransferase